MKVNLRFPLSLVALIIGLSPLAKAQIAFENIEDLERVKSGITYIAMKDPESPEAQAFIEVYKEHWTLSKFEFIKYSEIDKHLTPEASFFSIGGFATKSQFRTMTSNGVIRDGISFEHTHLFLELWTIDEKVFNKGRRKKVRRIKDDDRIRIARIELFTDFLTLSQPENIYNTSYDGAEHIRNWGPGILKNQLQALNHYASIGEEKDLYEETFKEEAVLELANEVLYIPDYTLIKFNSFTGDESKLHDEEELFEDYEPEYKLIDTEALNAKILESDTAFFYLIYIKSSTDKFISVINSKTGEIIYSIYTPVSYNIKSRDFRNLSRDIL